MRGLSAIVVLALICGNANALDDDRGPTLPFRVSGCDDATGRAVPCGYAPAIPAPPLRPAPAAPGTSFASGLIAIEEGRLRDAEAALKKAAREEMPDAWLGYAWTLHLAGKHVEAEAAFERVADEELASEWLADHAPALTAKYNQGIAALVAGDPVHAERLLRQALIAEPGWQPANALGIALAGQGRFAEAYAAYREALRHAALDAAASPHGLALIQRNMAFALARLGKRDEARAAITRALELIPYDPEFKALAGELAADDVHRAASP